MSTAMLSSREQNVALTRAERIQLIRVIDLLIPSDNDFPPPSSLHLIDTILHHLDSHRSRSSTLFLDTTKLCTALREMNTLANGNFCHASLEQQHSIIRTIEQRYPALFQTLWTLTNHSYYSQIALSRGKSSTLSLS
jgi:hypothetical protein